MLLQQGGVFHTTMPQEHAVTDLDASHRIHGVWLQPTTMMSIRTSGCVEPDALWSVSYSQPRLPQASGERVDEFVASLSDLDQRRILQLRQGNRMSTVQGEEG
eukprot:5818558-Pleurochrysis_carterae.AAC.1